MTPFSKIAHPWRALLAALALGALVVACKEPTQTQASQPPPPVTVAEPIQKEIVEWDEYTGRTDAVESVEVRPRVSGYILSRRSRVRRRSGPPAREWLHRSNQFQGRPTR